MAMPIMLDYDAALQEVKGLSDQFAMLKDKSDDELCGILHYWALAIHELHHSKTPDDQYWRAALALLGCQKRLCAQLYKFFFERNGEETAEKIRGRIERVFREGMADEEGDLKEWAGCFPGLQLEDPLKELQRERSPSVDDGNGTTFEESEKGESLANDEKRWICLAKEGPRPQPDKLTNASGVPSGLSSRPPSEDGKQQAREESFAIIAQQPSRTPSPGSGWSWV